MSQWPAIASAPVTPKRHAPEKNAFHSTPLNRGTAYHSEFSKLHTHDEKEPHVREDLKLEKQLPYDAFRLSLFGDYQGLHMNDDIILSISCQPDYQQLVKEFANGIKNETDRYAPFVELVNYVLSLIHQFDGTAGLEVMACENDPFLIRGSDARRKPDVVLAERSQVRNQHFDRSNPKQRKEYPFEWPHLMCFFEHKHDHSPLRTRFISNEGTSIDISTVENMLAPPVRVLTNSTVHNRVTRSSTSRASSQSAPRSLPSSGSRKRPATSQEPSGSTSRSKKVKTTSETQDILEILKQNNRHVDEARVQSASYAMEMISNGSIRSHAIGVHVINGVVNITYYTHAMIIGCEPINFMQDHRRFIRVIQGFASLSKQDWGIMDHLFKPPRIPPSESRKKAGNRLTNQFLDYELTLSTGDTLTLGETLYRQHGLIGRATCVVAAKWAETEVLDGQEAGKKIESVKRLKNGGVIVKFSWPAETRTSEREFVEHVDSIVYKDKKHEWVLQHLPVFIHAEEVEVDVVQRRFKDSVERAFNGLDFELRELRISVQEQLHPILELVTAEELLPAWRGIIDCYEWLHDVAQIMHRDISINNWMYRRNGKGEVVGVLIDLDLAVFTFAVDISSHHRTGTKPFLAIDLLLGDPKHKYRFDLESSFYAMCWQAHGYHDGEQVMVGLHPVYEKWVTANSEDLANLKTRFIQRPLREPTERFQPLSLHLTDIRMAFFNGMNAQSQFQQEYKHAVRYKRALPEFDDDTLGGHVTIRIIKNILRQPLQYD